MTSKRPAVRCRAHRTNGEPCGNYAMLGARVCHAHGGRAPRVRNAARRRLDYAQAYASVARSMAERKTQHEALAPWAGELAGLRFDAAFPTWVDQTASAKKARALAREMTATARILRDYARTITAPVDDEHEETR